MNLQAEIKVSFPYLIPFFGGILGLELQKHLHSFSLYYPSCYLFSLKTKHLMTYPKHFNKFDAEELKLL